MITNNDPKPPAFLKLIAHDVRWQIIQALAISDLRVQEICQAIDQPQNLVSYHLKKLHQAHLVVEHQSISDGREIYYGLDFETINDQLGSLGMKIHASLSPNDLNHIMLKDMRVLFVCTHNSARSQMAEGLLRNLTGGRVRVASAGTDPTTVHPLAIKVMAEKGIDISRQAAKSLDALQDQVFDMVITVCDRAKEACPVFPGNPVRIHWSIPDPAESLEPVGDQLKQFEAVSDLLLTRAKYLVRGFLSA